MQKAEVVKKDLPMEGFEKLKQASELAIDCEMMGLNVFRDRLCLVQISSENGPCYLIQIDENNGAPLLKDLMEDPAITKIFHFARMDCLFLKKRIDISVNNLYCTKIASKIARTYTDRHGLKELVRDLTGETMDKTSQSSDWGREELTKDQSEYAASDVKYLFKLKRGLEVMLKREGRDHLVEKLFEFIPHRVELDIMGYGDIFDHQ